METEAAQMIVDAIEHLADRVMGIFMICGLYALYREMVNWP